MYDTEIKEMIAAAKLAAVEILKIYNTNFDVEIKSDNSPVTLADKTADNLIRAYLSSKFPSHGFLTEESKDTDERFSKEFVFIVDPVDGTKEFVKKNGQFTTNIALARNGEVVAGLINIPAQNIYYFATLNGGAFKVINDEKPVQIHTNNKMTDLLVLKSMSFANESEASLIAKHSDVITKEEACGASTKFCRIAEGTAEISYRCSPNTKEWDVASGDIILSEAGGLMLKPDGTRMKYNKKDVYNREGYILINRKENFLF